MAFTHGRYRDLQDVLVKDEAALLTLWEAHTSVRHRCQAGSCEVRQALEEALSTVQRLLGR